MTNMSISGGDREMMSHYTADLLNRRKQLAPWPFTTAEQVTQLYMPPIVYSTFEKLGDFEPVNQWLHKQRYVFVKVPEVIRGEYVKIRIHSRDNMIANRTEPLPAVQSVAEWPKFHAWVKAAVKIELTNQLVGATIKDTLNHCTTFKQLAKALPETMKAIAQHNSIKRPMWGYARASTKYKDVMKELGEDGGKRARSMHPELQKILQDRRNLIESTMAQAVMLPNNDWIGDHPWAETWTSGLYLK